MPKDCSYGALSSFLGDVTYYMAIIDVLTHSGKTKKTAHAYKSVRYGVHMFFLL